MLSLQLLGGFRLTLDGQPLKIENKRQKALFAYLLLHAPLPQARKVIATTLWSESVESQASTNLRGMLSDLRKEWPALYLAIQGDQPALTWEAATPTCDVCEFRQLLKAAAATSDDGEMQTWLEQAAAFYQGELFPDCYDEWILSERERLHEQFLGALQQLSTLYEEQRNYHEAIRCIRRLLRFDPGREENYRHLMRLYAALGERPAIDRLYRECVQMLRTEFKMAPSPATLELYEQLLRAGVGEESSVGEAKPAELLPKSPLIGRNQEWKQLTSLWSQVNQQGAHGVLISGEAGIGKTRLLQELIDTLRRRGVSILSSSCAPFDAQSAYLPVIRWLRSETLCDRLHALEPAVRSELGRLLPCLLNELPMGGAPEVLPVSWQRTRLHEALTRTLTSLKLPLLLTIDNLQWCDADTLTWLHTLLQNERRLPVLLVACYNQSPLPAQHPLSTWRLTLQQQQRLSELALTALSARDSQALTEAWSNATLSEEQQAKLYRESCGNPLQLLEVLQADGLLSASLAESISDSLRCGFELLLAQLPLAMSNVLEMAALLDAHFTLSQLLQLGDGTEESVLYVVDDLVQRGLFLDKGDEQFCFRNQRLRQRVLTGLSSAKRRLWQKRIDNLLVT